MIKRIELNWKFNEVVREITDENEWYARKQQKLDEENRKDQEDEAADAKKETAEEEKEDDENKAMQEFESFRASLKLTSKFGKQEKYSGVRFGESWSFGPDNQLASCIRGKKNIVEVFRQ